MAYLNANRLPLLKSDAYTPEGLVREETKLNFDLAHLIEEGQVPDVSIRETVKQAIKLSELLKNVYLYYFHAEPQEKGAIIKEIFSKLTINEKNVGLSMQKGL